VNFSRKRAVEVSLYHLYSYACHNNYAVENKFNYLRADVGEQIKILVESKYGLWYRRLRNIVYNNELF
jgi:hypothetical protein